ncbi:MAG TPA: DUF2188 domain-containing protein [Solirubrobacterales bacterium]|nr:DUF2188 domain-containing protein [Solirubrobacterales bacterium]
MTKSVHIIQKDGGWAISREGGTEKEYATKREAVEAGRDLLRSSGGGEIVTHGRDGRIRDSDTVFSSRRRD